MAVPAKQVMVKFVGVASKIAYVAAGDGSESWCVYTVVPPEIAAVTSVT
jgi:hypothetical protein